jgi:type I restriction enzyme R subunit
MSLNESIVEDAALGWFEELGYAVGHGTLFAKLRRAKPHLAPGETAAERESVSEVISARRLREVIRWLSPAVSSRILAALRDTLQPTLLSGDLSPIKSNYS